MRNATVWLTLALAAVVVGSFAGPAFAHNSNNRGTIKVHDDQNVDTPQSNDPHVSCDIWIEGFGMVDDEGVLEFRDWPPTGDMSVVIPTGDDLDWSGTTDDTTFEFVDGAFFLPPGHYRVEAFSDGGHPGNFDHSSKSKMFWVDECDGDEPPECPQTSLEAIERRDGTVDVTPTNEGGEFNIYRSVDGGPFEYVDTVGDGETVVDGPFEAGTELRYLAHVFDGKSESRDPCARAEATAVPFFGSAVAVGAAAVVGVGAYVAMRRR